MVKNSTEYFFGIFFSVSFIYFVAMFFALKDRKANLLDTITRTNNLGESEIVQEEENGLIDI